MFLKTVNRNLFDSKVYKVFFIVIVVVVIVVVNKSIKVAFFAHLLYVSSLS